MGLSFKEMGSGLFRMELNVIDDSLAHLHEKPVSPDLAYSHTNESLDAIIDGLNVQDGDSILAICGSGDQAFALLEKAGAVRVVDVNHHQIAYMMSRKHMLEQGDIEGFLTPNMLGYLDGVWGLDKHPELIKFNLQRRSDFFLQNGRLEKIRRRLYNMGNCEHMNYIKAAQRGNQAKIYLSNAFAEYNKIANFLPKGGLVYVANRPQENFVPGEFIY